MKKIITIVLFLLGCHFVTAQNATIAKLKYEEAEEAYLADNYETVLIKLDEAQKEFGKTNPPIMHLRIMAQSKLLGEFPHNKGDLLLKLNQNCKFYLKEYEKISGIEDKYKEVYKTMDGISIYSSNPNFFKARELYYGDSSGFKQAVAVCQKAISEGDSHAMNLLGLMYGSGSGVEKSPKLELEWIQKSANAGSVFGILSLGKFYLKGHELVAKDKTKGIEYITKAANKGFSNAINVMGDMYYYGEYETPRNYKAASEWYLKAAEKGSISAMRQVGNINYFGGNGATKDY
ncbi:MAG: tetratricopeptide repeat protein, partial [Flavobacterium sp.]|uniref:tetratricopeptide repeat protein n=1 Tax=Flavobacterium sp. TaxID=239 RepID=UPI0032664111